jgi:enoyl-[acyl-carrier protein] reductase I
MGFLSGKRALIVGVASNRSIAWGTAEAMRRQGAEIAFSYQNDKLKSRVEECARACDSDIVLPCDVSDEGSIQQLFTDLGKRWDGLDIIVHSVAYAPKEELAGSFAEITTRQGFLDSHEISSYSLTALVKYGLPLLRGRQSAVVTMSYLGAVRSIPNYNVMGLAKASLEANVRYLATALGGEGIRVNAISAGPIKTLAASGIGGIRKLLDHAERKSPLRRNITTEEVGNTAAFLCSDLASGITGEITYVDGGYNITGMMVED